MRIYYVYILKCSDGSYYTGVTNCLERRFAEHVDGRNVTCYTFSRRPVELVVTGGVALCRGVVPSQQRPTPPKPTPPSSAS